MRFQMSGVLVPIHEIVAGVTDLAFEFVARLVLTLSGGQALESFLVDFKSFVWYTWIFPKIANRANVVVAMTFYFQK